MPSVFVVRPQSDSTVRSQSWIQAKGSAAEKLVFQNAKANGDIRISHAAIAGQILSKFGNVYASHSSLGDVFADKHIVLKNTTAKKVESDYGSIVMRQREKTDAKVSSIAAGNHVSLKRISVDGAVQSQYGHVLAKLSDLNNVQAYKKIVLADSSAKRLQSETGSVVVEQSGDAPAVISSIDAWDAVSLKNVSVEQNIQSQCGSVTAEKSTLQKVQASAKIVLIDSSATDLVSEFGSVTVRQTDGERRSISHITALGSVVAQGSDVEEVTLHVDQDEKGVLDLTDSQVGKVAVKVNDACVGKVDELPSLTSIWSLFFEPLANVKHFYANVNGKEFHSLDAYNEHLRGGKEEGVEPKPKHFNLLIKGQEEMPANISFDGFETDEISTEKTEEGILVKGEKKL